MQKSSERLTTSSVQQTTASSQPLLWRWQHLVPIILLIGTTLWGLYLGYLNPRRGRLDFALDSEATVASVSDSGLSELKLLYKDDPIADATVVSVYVGNSGNIDLLPLDWANPTAITNPTFRLIFPPNSRVLEAVSSGNASGQVVELRRVPDVPHAVTFAVILMNSGSSARLDVTLTGYRKGDGFSTEVKGVGLHSRRVMPGAHVVRPPWWHTALALLVSLAWPVFAFWKVSMKLINWSRRRYRLVSEMLFISLVGLYLLISVGSFALIATIYDHVRLVM